MDELYLGQITGGGVYDIYWYARYKVQGTTQQNYNCRYSLTTIQNAKLSQGPKLLKGHRTGKVLAEHTLSVRNVFDFIQEGQDRIEPLVGNRPSVPASPHLKINSVTSPQF